MNKVKSLQSNLTGEDQWREFVACRSRLLPWWNAGCANASRAPHQTSHLTRKPVPVLHRMVSTPHSRFQLRGCRKKCIIVLMCAEAWSYRVVCIFLSEFLHHSLISLLFFLYFFSSKRSGVLFGEEAFPPAKIYTWPPHTDEARALRSHRYPLECVLEPRCRRKLFFLFVFLLCF